MTDIVERLRKLHAMTQIELGLEAADALEAKDAEIEQRKEENDHLGVTIEELQAEIERLQAYIDGAIPNDEAGVQNLLAKTRNDALEEAAKVADDWEELSGKNLASLIRALKESGA
jgi:citrate synthase